MVVLYNSRQDMRGITEKNGKKRTEKFKGNEKKGKIKAKR